MKLYLHVFFISMTLMSCRLDADEYDYLLNQISTLMRYPKCYLKAKDYTHLESLVSQGKIKKAIYIDSSIERSFRPVHIAIAEKEYLLSEEDKEMIEMIHSSENDNSEWSVKAREFLGNTTVFDNTDGVLVWGDIKFIIKEGNWAPGKRTYRAYSCLIYPPDTDIEIRISVIENAIKNPVPGGEVYYEYFRDEATPDEIYGDARQPEFDFKKFFADFGRAIVESEMVKNIIAEQSKPDPESVYSSAGQPNRNFSQAHNAENINPDTGALIKTEEQNKSINFVILLAGIAALLLAGLYILKKTKSRH